MYVVHHTMYVASTLLMQRICLKDFTFFIVVSAVVASTKLMHVGELMHKVTKLIYSSIKSAYFLLDKTSTCKE